jgi:hypothetical protein
MKKVTILKSVMLAFMAAPSLLFAQLKVTSSGNVYVQRDSITGQSTLSIGSIPGMTGRYYDTWRMGIRANTYNTATTGNVIGIFGEGSQQYINNYRFSTGVWGTSNRAYQDNIQGMNYGVMGSLHNGNYGAAIYGANCDNAFFGFGQSLAGFFYGPVYIEGQLTSSEAFLSPSDMRLKRDIVAVKSAETDKGSTLDNLLSLEVLNYRLERPKRPRAIVDGVDTFEDPNEKRYASIRHYGVSAQDLQKLYPDLVVEGEDGYLSINYVELVPLLIRSLQELNKKIETMEGRASKRSASITGIHVTEKTASGKNILYQNTPNPFKELTTIRFSLADDAHDAAICIFDMSGKMLKKMPVSSGMESVSIGGYELGEGMFLYSLIVNGQEIDTKKMIITK